jgi:hypothetical protein
MWKEFGASTGAQTTRKSALPVFITSALLVDVQVMARRPLYCLAHSSRHGCCAPLLEFLQRSPLAASSSL